MLTQTVATFYWKMNDLDLWGQGHRGRRKMTMFRKFIISHKVFKLETYNFVY